MTVNVLWYVFTTPVCGVCVHIGVGIIVYSCYQGHFRNLKRENRQRYDSTLHFYVRVSLESAPTIFSVWH